MESQTILVVPRTALHPALQAPRAWVAAGSWTEAAGLLGLDRARWMPRPEAETDPEWKQVIPYVTVFDPDGRVLVYPRQGTEARLHAFWSLGIGGHIDRADAAGDEAPGPKLLARAARREVEEEYPVRWLGGLEVVGLISEDESEVGRVHVGVCCRLTVDPATARDGDGELRGHRWAPPGEPAGALPEGAGFELWSELAWALHREGR